MLENFRLHVFRTVALRLNFSRAAEQLLLTQPAVTGQIKALEETLGVALFDRQGGRIQLTSAGHALLPFAERLHVLTDEAIAAVAAVVGEDSGTLVLGASQTIAQYVLPGLLARFLAERPRVRLSVRSGNTDATVDAMLRHEVDLALIEGPPVRKDLRLEPFARDRMVLVVPALHPWAGRKIAPEQLLAEPMLVREFGSGSRRVIERALAASGVRIRDLHLRLELDSSEALLHAVAAGLGVAFVSRWAARSHLALGTVRRARVAGLRISRQLSLAYPAGPELCGTAATFRGFLLSLADSELLRGRRQTAIAGQATPPDVERSTPPV